MSQTQHTVLPDDLADRVSAEALIDGRTISGYIRVILESLQQAGHPTLLAAARSATARSDEGE